MDSRILIPVRYSAWLTGDLGRRLEKHLADDLKPVNGLRLVRMPRGFLVEGDEAPGPFLETVHRAVARLEDQVSDEYPVFHREMGPVWTGTLQVVFPQA